jgi:predicted transcriptional regulator
METFSPTDVLHMLRSHISYENSQKDLAKEIGVSQAFICGVLGGKKEPWTEGVEVPRAAPSDCLQAREVAVIAEDWRGYEEMVHKIRHNARGS